MPREPELKGVSRKARQSRYKAQKAPEAGTGDKKAFTVSEHKSFMGEDGNKYRAGDVVYLSEDMANYMAKRGFIDVEFDFKSDETRHLKDENDALKQELERLIQQQSSGVEKASGMGRSVSNPEDGEDQAAAVSYQHEGVSGSDADAGGTEFSGGSDTSADNASNGTDDLQPRRKRRSL